MASAGTTISCRAFALIALSIALLGSTGEAAERPAPPRLPIAEKWTQDLTTAVATAPVVDGEHIVLALRSAQVVARHASDGRELWRIEKDVSMPLAAADGLVFVAAGDAIEAIRAADGASAWLVPRVKAVAPLVVAAGLVFAVTSEELLAIRVADGGIAWRTAAGGVRLAPAVDGGRVYVGANDGRIAAMEIADGTQRWEAYVSGGVTSIAAHDGRVYAGGGDKRFHCLDARNGSESWSRHIGAAMIGRIAVDDERVYVVALDNVVYGLDRENGNQRWKRPLSRRPIGGVRVQGHVVFVAVAGTDLVMLYDRTGDPSGLIPLPAELSRDAPPALRETEAGLELFIVTGGLSNEWQLTHVGPAGELPPVPFSSLTELPGVAFLTDPELAPLLNVLPMVFGDPVLRPLDEAGWPILLEDPPLVPLTTLPGLQLRPLSPVLPPRRGA